MKINKQKTIIIILGILLIISVGYIIQDKYVEYRFQQGASLGYQQAIIDIIQRATTCQTIPLTIENKTINLIAMECLQNG